ncbi:hypothetical protein J1N35_021655 [Gossypium stocksii]|uniref:non-specific serine/threonine protein kinase n=1 Tax=Gossypium stocksii TaxID=47602 RepID=A0A9D4A2P3_9ROSI|nr:hypothetical protein J1N35_021655 [Gossypium stocksii]
MTQQFPSDEKVEGKEQKRVKSHPHPHPHPHDTTYGSSKSLQVNSTTLYSKSFFELGFNFISLELRQALNPFFLHLSALKMVSPSFSSSLPLPLFCFLFIMLGIPVSLTSPDHEREFENCRNGTFKCGNIIAGFPFRGGDRKKECGHPDFELLCDRNTNTTTMKIHDVPYRVLEILPDRQILRISNEEMINKGICRPPFADEDWVLDPPGFTPGPGFASVTLFYDCHSPISPDLRSFSCNKNDDYSNVSVAIANNTNIHPEGCFYSANISILQTSLERLRNRTLDWKGALKTGLEVPWRKNYSEECWKCNSSGGACGFGIDYDQVFHCYCPPGNWSWPEFKECHPQPLPPHTDKKDGKALKLGLGLGAAGVITLIGIGTLCVRQHRRKKIVAQLISRDLPTSPSSKGPTTSTTNYSQSNSSYSTSKYDIERGSTYFGAHVFNYEELEEATDNFNPSRQLGEGGFGTVYYGVLRDGRLVAVKRLYENNFKRVDQYMNEIEILTLILHPNLVKLYGCTSRRSRELLLVYEYIPNGTVADHLHGKRSNSGFLTWHVRLRIAIETATALAYLHGKEIIHRDVKSNNILLDKNFHVKVADFGLSRLFPNDVTHVSTAPQGTPGYVDPEYHQCYHLTEKSDVYSFGVVLVELISAKKAVDVSRHRHDINLANMAISRIQNQALHELVDPSLGFENDFVVKNTVTAVAGLAFRCLQQERDMRPSMEEVLEALEEIKGVRSGSDVVDIRSGTEVVDIKSDDVGLLKSIPPPFSPDSATDKWVQIKSM